MKSIRYILLPYNPGDLYAIRTNDDGTFSMRTMIGRFDDEYGPQKRRFDLSGSKPYVQVESFDQIEDALKKVKIDNIGYDLNSVGFCYYGWDQKICANRRFVQAGYNDDYLCVTTIRKDEDEDFRFALIDRTAKMEFNPFTKEDCERPLGSWRWHRFEEQKDLNEKALTMVSRPVALRMATEIFMKKWENKLADFKQWCGVIE